MANYFYTEIHSEKLTAAIAAEILAKIGTERPINNFTYYDGHLMCYTRGLTNISDILNSYGFTDEEVKVEDEFERFWNSLSSEELEQICNETKMETEVESKKEVRVNYQSKFYRW